MAFAKQGVAGELYACGIGLVGTSTSSDKENCGVEGRIRGWLINIVNLVGLANQHTN